MGVEQGLVSYLPSHHRHKAAIDTAVRSLLASLSEPWEVIIRPAHSVSWWMVTVVRCRDGYTWPFFVDPKEQNAQDVTAAIQDAMKTAT